MRDSSRVCPIVWRRRNSLDLSLPLCPVRATSSRFNLTSYFPYLNYTNLSTFLFTVISEMIFHLLFNTRLRRNAWLLCVVSICGRLVLDLWIHMSSVYVSAVTALEEFITLWGIGADDAILTKKLNLVDCATECSAIPECNAFKMRAKWCILQQRAGLHRRCEQFECDRMYIKKTYSSESLHARNP